MRIIIEVLLVALVQGVPKKLNPMIMSGRQSTALLPLFAAKKFFDWSCALFTTIQCSKIQQSSNKPIASSYDLYLSTFSQRRTVSTRFNRFLSAW